MDDPPADEGGTGAPPQPSTPNRAPSQLTREYRGRDIAVGWYASRCIHAAACIRALPQVFNAKRRPWIEVDAASADAVADAVQRCPTGALHFVRLDQGPPESVPESPEVRSVADGPYYIKGTVEVMDEDGNVYVRDTRIALCRCGKSKHAPLCDNTHRATGFRTSA